MSSIDTINSINRNSIEALDLASSPKKKREPAAAHGDRLMGALDLAGEEVGSLPGRTVSRLEMKGGRFSPAIKRAFLSIQNAFECVFSSKAIKGFTFGVSLIERGGKLIDAITNVVKPLSYHSVENESSPSNPLLWLIVKVFPLLFLPFVILNLGSQLKDCVKAYRQGNRGLGLEAGLNVITEVSNLSWIAGTIIKGLKYFEVPLKKSALVASTALLHLSAALSLASFLLKIKHWYDHKKLQGTVKDISDAIQQDEKTLKKLYGVENGADLKRRLTTIWEKAQTYQGEERKKFLNPVNEALQGRVKSRGFSHGLTVLSTTISLIATPILMFGGPLTPVGFALVGVSALIDITKTIKEWRQDSRFEHLIEEHTPKVEYLLKLPFNDASRKHMQTIPWDEFKKKIRTKALINWNPQLRKPAAATIL